MEIINLKGKYFSNEREAIAFFHTHNVFITNTTTKYEYEKEYFFNEQNVLMTVPLTKCISERIYVEGIRIYGGDRISYWIVPIILKREQVQLKQEGKLVEEFAREITKEFYCACDEGKEVENKNIISSE